ncbi:MAG: putative ribosomal rna-processing, partial [Streblomastix strix]
MQQSKLQRLTKLTDKGLNQNKTHNHDTTNKKKVIFRPINAEDLSLKLNKKLKGGRFRSINEELYTITSDSARISFRKDPKLFDTYHEGYRIQANQWPINPLDVIIRELKDRRGLTIADLGCGEGRLGESCPNCVIHSFDLVKRRPHIKV